MADLLARTTALHVQIATALHARISDGAATSVGVAGQWEGIYGPLNSNLASMLLETMILRLNC